MTKLKETQLAGLSLILGILVFYCTIFFEYKIGWISLEGGPKDVHEFLLINWDIISNIWYWQMISGVLMLLSYFLFFKNTRGIKTLFWAILIVSSLLSVAAFFLTLGSYEPALKVYDTSPEIFDSIAGGISLLYRNLKIVPFIYEKECIPS